LPIYEYRCADCGRRVSIWWRTFSEAEASEAICPRCGSHALGRLLSRVTMLRGTASAAGDDADAGGLDKLDENDPRALARWMRRMSDETGAPLDAEMVQRLEAGEDPASIEQSMPDLAAPAADDML